MSVGGDWGVEHFAQSPADNGASNGANSNQATIVRYVFSAALSGSVLLPPMARKERQDRDAEGKELKQAQARGPHLFQESSGSGANQLLRLCLDPPILCYSPKRLFRGERESRGALITMSGPPNRLNNARSSFSPGTLVVDVCSCVPSVSPSWMLPPLASLLLCPPSGFHGSRNPCFPESMEAAALSDGSSVAIGQPQEKGPSLTRRRRPRSPVPPRPASASRPGSNTVLRGADAARSRKPLAFREMRGQGRGHARWPAPLRSLLRALGPQDAAAAQSLAQGQTPGPGTVERVQLPLKNWTEPGGGGSPEGNRNDQSSIWSREEAQEMSRSTGSLVTRPGLCVSSVALAQGRGSGWTVVSQEENETKVPQSTLPSIPGGTSLQASCSRHLEPEFSSKQCIG
ncbi:hypothetical protein LEMLEM_LOCUS87 [Lemmus lemmus]